MVTTQMPRYQVLIHDSDRARHEGRHQEAVDGYTAALDDYACHHDEPTLMIAHTCCALGISLYRLNRTEDALLRINHASQTILSLIATHQTVTSPDQDDALSTLAETSHILREILQTIQLQGPHVQTAARVLRDW